MKGHLSSSVEASPNVGTLEAVASSRPDGIALVEGERAVTWAEWNDQADRLAEYFSSRGLMAGDIVGVRTGIRIEWCVVHAALSKIGCLVLGLNYRLTPRELRGLMADCDAVGLVLDDHEPAAVLEACSDLDLRFVVSVDVETGGAASWTTAVDGPLVRRYASRFAEMVIYTSGTTGEPKRIARRQFRDPARAIEFYRAVGKATRLSSDDVMLICMPFVHASAPSQLRNALMFGATVVLLRRFDPEIFLAEIERCKVTASALVPTMVNRLRGLHEDIVKQYDVSSVRSVTLGAAPVTFDQKLWMMEHFGDVVFEGYGLTEAGMVSRIGPEDQRERPGSCGRAYPFVEIEIRDFDQAPIPLGEVGMIWVNTPVVIEGYDGQAPFGPDVLDARGFLKTGDMGYLDADGFLYITDREKDMIVSGGVNIYPPEIEAALCRFPTVVEAAVIGIPHDDFGEQVMAFVQLKPGSDTSVDDINEFLVDELASYKRPRRIEIVGELPHGVSGKILKRELREPFWEGRTRKV